MFMKTTIAYYLVITTYFVTADFEIIVSPSGEHNDGQTGRYCSRDYECQSNRCFFMRCAETGYDGTTKGSRKLKEAMKHVAEELDSNNEDHVNHENEEEEEMAIEQIIKKVENGIVIREESDLVSQRKQTGTKHPTDLSTGMSNMKPVMVQNPGYISQPAEDESSTTLATLKKFDITKVLKIIRSEEGVITLIINYDKPVVAIINGVEQVLLAPKFYPKEINSQEIIDHEHNTAHDHTTTISVVTTTAATTIATPPPSLPNDVTVLQSLKK